jgi:hypothetical protein
MKFLKRFSALPFVAGIILSVFYSLSGYSQANLHYRTRATTSTTGSGNWSTATIWETGPTASGPWTVATVPPNSTSQTILIRSGSTVTIPNGYSVSVDQLTNAGTLTVNTGGTLTIAENGTSATDFTNSRTLNIAGGSLIVAGSLTTTATFSISGSGTVTVSGTLASSGTFSGATVSNTSFSSTARFRHLGNTQAIPLATWASGSVFEVAGFKTSSVSMTSTNWSQNFSNVEINCTSLASGVIINFNGLLKNIGGNLSVLSTGGSSSTGKIILSGVNSASMSVDGNLSLSASTRTDISSTATNVTLTVAGNLTCGGTLTFASGTSGTATLSVAGNVSILSGGQITTASAGPGATAGIGTLRFTKNGTQTFSNAGTISNQINYAIVSTSNLDLGTSALTGNGTFTLAGEILLGSTHANGAIQAAGTGEGNIQVAGTRTFASNSKITYNGTGEQFIGAGHPTSGTNVQLEIDNGTDVTFATGVTSLVVTGALTLTNGTLEIPAGGTLRTDAAINVAIGNIGVQPTSNLTLNGSSQTGVFPFSAGNKTLNNFTINRSSGSVTFANDLTVNGTFTMTAGNVNFSGVTLALNGSFSRASLALLFANASSDLIIGGSGALGSNLEFSPTANTLNTLTIDRTSGTVTVAELLTVNNALTLTSGALTNAGGTSGRLTLGSGATLTRSSNASLLGNAVLGGPYDLIFTGTTLTTGLEAQGSLRNLTSNVSGNVTLNNAITLTEDLTINTGAFLSGTNAIACVIFYNAGSFTAPSSTLTLTGDFTNDGTFIHNQGSIVFDNVTAILGNSVSIFYDITVNGIVIAPADEFHIEGDFTNNNAFIASADMFFEGDAAQMIQGSGVTDFNNLTIDNPTVVSVESDQNILGVLTLNTNTTVFDADGNCNCAEFTLVSQNDSPAVDASIAEIPSGASVSGSVTAQRIWGAEGLVNRYIAIPLTSAPVSDLQDDFSVTGPFVGTNYPCTGCLNNGASLKYYNESVKGAMSKGYTGYPNTNSSAPLVPGRGYLAYMYEDVVVNLDVRGPINQGNFVFPFVTYTLSSPPSPGNDGWNLLGNPYPSPIQFNNDAAAWTKVKIDNYVYVNDQPNNVFRYWDPTNQVGDLTNGVIAPGQAFWIKANAASPSLTVTEQAKVSGVEYAFYRKKENATPHLTVSMSSGNVKDNIFLVRNDVYSNAPKLENPSFEVAFYKTDEEKYVMETFSQLDESTIIPLSVRVSEAGEYRFSFTSTSDFSEASELYLVDTEQGTFVPVSGTPYFFYSHTGFFKDRFYLTKSAGLASKFEAVQVTAYPNPAKDFIIVRTSGDSPEEVALLNNFGQPLMFTTTARGEDGTNQCKVDVSGFPAGVYLIRVDSSLGRIVRKVIKE